MSILLKSTLYSIAFISTLTPCIAYAGTMSNTLPQTVNVHTKTQQAVLPNERRVQRKTVRVVQAVPQHSTLRATGTLKVYKTPNAFKLNASSGSKNLRMPIIKHNNTRTMTTPVLLTDQAYQSR